MLCILFRNDILQLDINYHKMNVQYQLVGGLRPHNVVIGIQCNLLENFNLVWKIRWKYQQL